MQLLASTIKQVDMIFADPPYFLSKGFTMKYKGRIDALTKANGTE